MIATAPTAAYEELERRDDALTALIARHGTPNAFAWGILEAAAGGDAFAELALHIVSQQVSSTAALAIFGRLRELLGGFVAAAAILDIPVEPLGTAGLSGAKARSLHDLAERVLDGRLSFARLARSDDATAQAELEAVRDRALVGADVPLAQPAAAGHLPGGRCRPATRGAGRVRAGAAAHRRRAHRARRAPASIPILRRGASVGARQRAGSLT